MGASSEEKQVRSLLKEHFTHLRTTGGHELWTREGLARPLVVTCSGRSRRGGHKNRRWKFSLRDIQKILKGEQA